MAISGLFTFAWTTGQLFAIVGYQHDLVAALQKKRRELRKAEQERRRGFRPEGSQHAHAVAAEEPQKPALSSDERRALRDEIEQKLQQLHAAERAEIEGLRRQERE